MAVTVDGCAAARWRAGGSTGPRAFTLIEMTIVVAVLALLAAILVPSMTQAFEVAYSALCKKNLHGLSQAMQCGSPENPLAVPDPNAWLGHAVKYGSRDLLLCKKDEEQRAPTLDLLSEYYILQNNGVGSSDWRMSNVQAILEGNEELIGDNQIRYGEIPAHPTAHSRSNRPCWCWIPQSRADNQHLISVVDEASIFITIGETCITIESIVGCNCDICNSDHWLMIGEGDNPRTAMQDDEVVMMLGGRNCREVDKNSPIVLYTEKTSYGMNGLIECRKFGPQQLMLMDANMACIEPDADQGNWLGHIRDRHLGRANIATVGGSVRTMTVAELHDEYLLLEDEGPASRSLWGRRGCPRQGD